MYVMEPSSAMASVRSLPRPTRLAAISNDCCLWGLVGVRSPLRSENGLHFSRAESRRAQGTSSLEVRIMLHADLGRRERRSSPLEHPFYSKRDDRVVELGHSCAVINSRTGG